MSPSLTELLTVPDHVVVLTPEERVEFLQFAAAHSNPTPEVELWRKATAVKGIMYGSEDLISEAKANGWMSIGFAFGREWLAQLPHPEALKVWLVTYPGSYLGGSAVVLAHTAEHALALLSACSKYDLQDATIEEISGEGPRVLYDDDGDY